MISLVACLATAVSADLGASKSLYGGLSPRMQERVSCSVAAANRYQIPANIMLALAEMENGNPGQYVKNTNGTSDVGAMQFNTAYLRDLRKYGISETDAAAPGCYPYHLAAWRVRQHIVNDNGDLWTKVANYHSRTPRYNSRYRLKLIRGAAKWADWLETRMTTVDVRGRF